MLKKGRDEPNRSAQPHLQGQKGPAASFDHWLDRELRRLREALSAPVQPNLVEVIERHRKITR